MLKIIVGLLGLIWIVLGVSGLVSPKKTQLYMSKFLHNYSRQVLGLLALIIGILLLLAAPAVKESWFVLVLGIAGCLKGAMTVIARSRIATILAVCVSDFIFSLLYVIRCSCRCTL